MNGQQTFQGKPVTLASLNPGEALKVQYDYQESRSTWPTGWRRLRQVELQGVLAEDFDGRALSVIQDNRQVVKLPFAVAIRDHRQRSAGGETVGV